MREKVSFLNERISDLVKRKKKVYSNIIKLYITTISVIVNEFKIQHFFLKEYII